jgi:hypothetical protein
MNLPILPPWASVTLKFAPYVAIAILAGLLFLSHGKVESLEAKVSARDTQVSALIEARDFFKTAVDQRDTLINRQNSSIDALAQASVADRTVYLKGLEAARVVSADNMKVSTNLLALKAPDGELEQCRAARDLLEQELVN